MSDPIRRAAEAVAAQFSNAPFMSAFSIETVLRQHIGPLPAWHEKPTCTDGWWLTDRGQVFIVEDIEVLPCTTKAWFGPIPLPKGATT